MECTTCGAPKEVGKTCKSARAKAYYLLNADRIKEKSRINAAAERLANPEYFLARAGARTKKYREKHPDKAREGVAKYRAANPDWGVQTPEQKERALARTAKYKAENSELIRAQDSAKAARYRAKFSRQSKGDGRQIPRRRS